MRVCSSCLLLALVGCSSRTEMPAVDAKRIEFPPSRTTRPASDAADGVNAKAKDEPNDESKSEQAVLIFLKLSSPMGTKAEFEQMTRLETKLEQLVQKA